MSGSSTLKSSESGVSMETGFGHIILDFDGVLADSLSAACEEMNAITERHYPAIPRVAACAEDMARVYCGPLKTSLRRFGLTDTQSQDFFDRHSTAMQARASAIRPFDDVLKVIGELPRHACSIVTSSYSNAVREILSKSPDYADGMFRFISGRELKEPKSKKITDILEAVGVPARQALHVGDMVSDLVYSRTVSVPFCAVGWGYHPISYLRAFDPDYAVATVDEFGLLLGKAAPESGNRHTIRANPLKISS